MGEPLIIYAVVSSKQRMPTACELILIADPIGRVRQNQGYEAIRYLRKKFYAVHLKYLVEKWFIYHGRSIRV